MADYLFEEALGRGSDDELHAAKAVLMPLRGHGGRLGWAATILLEGGECLADYHEAISILMATARGAPAPDGQRVAGGAVAPVISLLPRLGGDQLALPGIDV